MDTFAIAIIILILIIAGFLIGTISSIVGIGGGAFYIIIMMILLVMPIDGARDTSAFIILLFSGVGLITSLKQKKVDIKLSLLLASFALLGGITATILLILFPMDNLNLKIVIASVVLVSGLNMIRKALKSLKISRVDGKDFELDFSFKTFDYKPNLIKGFPIFFIAGFVAYISGIGGGLLFVPILSMLFGIPIHYATAMSTAIIFFNGIYNATVRIFVGDIVYLTGILIGIGAIVGSICGSKISGKMSKSYLQFFISIILIGLAIRMYF